VSVTVHAGAARCGVGPARTYESTDRRHGPDMALLGDEVVVSQLAVQAVPRLVRGRRTRLRVSDC